MFGKLTLADFPFNEPVIMGALVSGGLGALVVLGLITYFKKWGYLWNEWLISVDHKKIGVMYIVFAIIMLLRGFADGIMMRANQMMSVGDHTGYLTQNHYDQVFSAHGTIMIIFVAMPFMVGLMNLVIPQQIGARDVAFPLLNSLSFWMTAAGGALMMISLGVGVFSNTGWTGLAPLFEKEYNPGVGVDYWIWAFQIAGVGSTLTGINFLVTIIKMRAPGMKLMRMPMFTWTTLTANVLMVLAFPAITVALVLVSLDRYLGMHFFTNDMGGNMMLYNNIFWMWGHPEVYIVILPAFGIFSEVVATFSKKKLFGYVSLVYATAVIMLLSFLVWLHHFFTMANTPNVNIFFGIATMLIGVPTGVKIYDWLLTMYRGRITFSPAMHWMLGFLVLFVIGGMTGVLMAVPGADYVVHNTTFLVAHFHNVLIPGALFGYLAGYNYWFPKVFGFKLNERWGKLSFWGWALGFALAFFPLYVTGFMGMPRRISHISNLSWEPFLIVAMLGTLVVGFGVFAMLVQLFFSIKDRNKNLDLTGDPWDGRTLEWATDSPTPVYNFAVIPVVKELDDFKRMKDDGSVFHRPEKYDPIVMPKDKVYGPIMGALLIAFGFSMVWYIWWLAIISFLGILITVVIIGNDNDNEYIISAEEVKAIEDKRYEKLAAALKNKIEED
ncbi:cbb3-type cytochrome c oxidase subunit I [Parabacteroides sp. FAFU027]|uniref:cbb3-type cytochrome c oxidase subunit I n=1 Tax=Parabacteroides sp. FAFU027 TaxID=2922715 RepID=UPI001FAF6F84|nr:cbb3-type cytochrome c oxidase subunit I [Parabacteroides sp. FAFU027]